MSPVAHICNTFFERELESPERPLIHWLRSHPVVLQLQFLPLLYAEEHDPILVSDLPENPDPRLQLLRPTPVETWGPSLAIAKWNQEPLPNWERVRTLNSKIFSFTHSPQLPGAALLHNEEEAKSWIEKTPGPKILKTPFGTAGNGHIHVGRSSQPLQFPLIGEPWVERLLDFSTQWKDGVFLGATIFENEPNGTYESTLAGPAEKIFGPHLWALEAHFNIAQNLMPHFPHGHVGIDAFIYRWEGKTLLHPIVEINARKTMSWVALQMQRRSPEKSLRFAYTRSANGLLPSHLMVNGKRVQFQRNISVAFLG